MTDTDDFSLSPARLLAIFLLAALAGHAPLAAARADPGSAFFKELKAQNAHHLKQPVSLPKEKMPLTLEREWEDKITRTSWRLDDGPLSLEVTLTKGGPPDALLAMTPKLSLSVEGEKILDVEGSASFPDNPVFVIQIAEMDPANPYAEVAFSSFTGGAHCCSDTKVLTSSKDGKSWKIIEMDALDGDLLKLRDLDGDGRYEFAFHDNAFLYAFGCYACSAAPLRVLQLSDGELKDHSRQPRFRAHQLNWLQNMLEWAGEGMDMNGYLAGYVAQKILLGEGADAWKLMLKHHDREAEWGLAFCAVKENDKGECPQGKKTTLSYPDALKRFFTKTGYELKQ